MNFSSLVLMKKDKDTKMLVNELGSYEVNEGAEYISKLYCEDNIVNVFFDTKVDVEEWEYTAIFDIFNEELFSASGFTIESIDDEYNPTWRIQFEYNEEHSIVQDKINQLCNLIQDEMERIFNEIKDKKEEYI